MSDTFTTREAAALLDLTPAEVRRFARAALPGAHADAGSEYTFRFRDLVVLRMAAGLRRARVPAGRIAGALEGLSGSGTRELAGLRLEALGSHVVVRDGEVVWRADSGQLQLDLGAEPAGATGPPVGEAAPARGTPGVGAVPARALRADVAGIASEALEVDACLDRAQALEGDDPDAALAWYERAVATDASRAEAHAGLGFALQGQGRLAEAADRYRYALDLEADATVAFNLGVALDDLGRTAEAKGAYEEALRLDTRLADAHFNLSCLLERLGDRQAALRHMVAYREAATDD